MKATAALEELVSHSQKMATVEIYRANDPDALPGVKKIYLEQLTTSLEKKQRSLLPALWRLNKVLRATDEQIRLNKAMLAPCKRLPREVLSEIFLLVASDNDPGDLVPIHQYKLASVCSLWRSVALNTAQLWSAICMSSEQTAETLERELGRTKCCPLDLEICTIDTKVLSTREAWNVLRQYGHRWRTVILHEPLTVGSLPESVSCPALQALNVDLDLPKMLTADGVSQPSGEVLLLDCLRDAPILRRVEAIFTNFDSPTQMRFPDSWRLSHLRLEILSCNEPFHPLQRMIEQAAETLERLEMRIDECNDMPRPLNSPTYHFEKLHGLKFNNGAYGFIMFIDAPVLASLCIRGAGNSGEDHEDWDSLGFPSVTEMVSKVASFHALRRLELEGVGLRDASALLTTLRELPDLDLLRLAEVFQCEGKLISNALLAGLTRGVVSVDGVDTPSNALYPLPKLGRLFLHLYAQDATDVNRLAGSLRRLALSRHPSVANQQDENGSSLRPLDAFHATYGRVEKDFAADVVPSWGERFKEDRGWDSD